MLKRRAAPVDEFDGDSSASTKRARMEEGSDHGVDVPPTETQTQAVSVEQMGLGMGDSER